MPKKPIGFDDNEKDEQLEYLVKSIIQNTENLKKILKDISGLCDVVDQKYESNTVKIVKKIDLLQNEVREFETALVKQAGHDPIVAQPTALSSMGPPIIFRCKSWDEFQSLASQPQLVAFSYRESDRLFEADAQKSNVIYVYLGEMPPVTDFLKAWLSNQLATSSGNIFEGIISQK